MLKKPIKNLLIDLGDVLYAIDLNRSLSIWEQMAADKNAGVNFSKNSQHDLFSLLDKGQISIEEFADELIKTFQLSGSREAVIEGWKALLIGVIPGRYQAIERLASSYNLALLSNTNKYHYQVFRDECEPMFNRMKHVFLSFEMGMRKPDPEIFTTTLHTAGWKAGETLFLDDSISNIEGAANCGLQTLHISSYDVFDQVLSQLNV